MGKGLLKIDLEAIAENWRSLGRMSDENVETAAVVKANAYGLGVAPVAQVLARAGARRFFVALAQEGRLLREALGPGPDIFVFAGHMEGDSALIRDCDLIPMLNSIEQVTLHFETAQQCPFGIQLDTGMNRLGMEKAEWFAVADLLLAHNPALILSHLACADSPDHSGNRDQLHEFHAMTDGAGVPRSLAATGGIFLGPAYHFDMVRPGIGLYGGLPYDQAKPVVDLALDVIQVRSLSAGESVGYGYSWSTDVPARIAILAGGYADGLIRRMGNRAKVYANDIACPLVGRVSMDVLTVDVSHLVDIPSSMTLIGPQQTIDDLAASADTIGYEILTSLGNRYQRDYGDYE